MNIHTETAYVLVTVLSNRDSSVNMVTGYELDDRDTIPGGGKIFPPPQFPDRL